MKKLFRIVAMVIINLVTLPIQIAMLLAVLASNLTTDEWDDLIDFCEDANSSNKTWIKTGRFPE